tara:strand:- start:8302 stop:9411 length:1110 start_codon:yes stop_codon:yes gene_type:complete
MKIDKINVRNRDTDYPIFIGNGALSLLGKQIKSMCPQTRKIALILDKNIPQKFKKKIKRTLSSYKVFSKEYLPNENLKSFKEAGKLVEKLLQNKFNRGDTIVAVGGGIIGDFAGFVSSILKRGINFINVPSTLLSQVDSSIGGKTGVNSKEGKNLIGSFYQPKLVISELALLKSLPQRELVCGFAEILKYSLIRDKKFFYFLKKNSKKILEERNFKILRNSIIRSCRNKIYFVTRDEKETGKRMLLNFGHTFAHGIEAASNFSRKINHGEAVLIGMLLATRLSVKKRICSSHTLNEIEKIYNTNNLPSSLKKYFSKEDFNKIVNYMVNDKKNNDDKINLILIRGIGKTTLPGSIKMSQKQMKIMLKRIT